MSDMTINQIREAKIKAEEQIGAILLELHRTTRLDVFGVAVRTTSVNTLGERYSRIVDMRVQIALESP